MHRPILSIFPSYELRPLSASFQAGAGILTRPALEVEWACLLTKWRWQGAGIEGAGSARCKCSAAVSLCSPRQHDGAGAGILTRLAKELEGTCFWGK